jgi:putative two-component system response regulator
MSAPGPLVNSGVSGDRRTDLHGWKVAADLSSSGSRALQKTRLLLVDDERRIRETFSLLLEDLGYSVKTASCADDALALLSTDTFHIAFIDQFLGPDRGVDLMNRMSAVDPDLHFVIISGNSSTDLAVNSFKRGASDFISKPFFAADLIRSIEFVNKRRQLDREKKEFLRTLSVKLDEAKEELRAIYFPVLSSLAQAMEKRDIDTYGHSMRVKSYSNFIAEALSLGDEDREHLKVAAMLHDIGKIGTSDFILGKPGPLDAHELREVRSHPQKGVEILRPLTRIFGQFDQILPAILHHHEHYDGSGYPAGLSGEEIPLLARIIAVADTYDAILSDRPYRAASNHHRAIGELSGNAGRQFDKKIITAFVDAQARNGMPLHPY